MDLVIIVLLILIVVICFRRFSNFVYAVAIIDIFLRLLYFLRLNLPIPVITSFLAKYFPKDIPSVLAAYSSGILYTLLIWGFWLLYILFEWYILQTFIHRKK